MEDEKLPNKSCRACAQEFRKFVNLKSTVKSVQIKLYDAIKFEDVKEENTPVNIKVEPEAHFDDLPYQDYFDEFNQFEPSSVAVKEEQDPSSEEKFEEPKKKAVKLKKRKSKAKR